MKIISRYMIKYWYAYALGLICMVVSIALDMLSPQITKKIIDDVIVLGEINLLSKLLIMILAIGIGRSIFLYFKEVIFDLVSSKIATDLRHELFNHIQGLSLSFFDKNNTGELMSRVKDDIDNIWNALGFVGMLLIEVAIHTSIVLFCMIRLSPSLTIIPVIAMPIVASIAMIMERRLGKIYGQISEENAALNTVAQENLAGVRTVKSFAREKHEIKKFLSHNKRYYDLNIEQSNVFIRYFPIFQFISKLVPLLVIIIGGFQVINGKISLGTLGAFTEYSMNIVWPMEMLGWLTNDFSSALASNKKINKIYNQSSEIIEPKNPVILDNVKGHIRFDHVSFSIEGKQILNQISFDLPAGKTIGIMGATGTGKTSIINLLQRFYDVSEGQITIDGLDIKDFSLTDLRENIAIVMQDVFLFSDTISENIKLGKKSNITKEQLLDAATKAQAKDFIERMDKQYETIVGERGVGLSGGQKQRISIARALSKEAPILVFDDSTSALDMETEHLIQKSLSMVNTSKIIIAHRISGVRSADEIIILEDGKISERGTHESLLKEKGYYYKTYIAQYTDYQEEVDVCL